MSMTDGHLANDPYRFRQLAYGAPVLAPAIGEVTMISAAWRRDGDTIVIVGDTEVTELSTDTAESLADAIYDALADRKRALAVAGQLLAASR